MRMLSLLVTTTIMVAPLSAALAKDEALAKAIAASHRTGLCRTRQGAQAAERLEFFGIKPALTVVEILPGGGYWTEILAPYLKGNGTYYVAMPPRGIDAFRKKLDANPAVYDEVKVTPLGTDAEIAPAGSADLVLTFRNVHNWMAGGVADRVFAAFFAALNWRCARRGRASREHGPPAGPEGCKRLRTRTTPSSSPRKQASNASAGRKCLPTRRTPRTGQKAFGHCRRRLRWARRTAKYLAVGEADNFVLKFEKPKK